MTSLISTNTPTLTSLESSGISIVTVDSGARTIPQPNKSPLSDSSVESVGSTNTTTPTVIQQLSATPNYSSELVKVVPSRVINPHNLTSDATSPTGFKVSVSSTSIQSGTVQVIDLTKQCSSDTQVAATPSQTTPPLQLTPQLPKQVAANSVRRVSSPRETRRETRKDRVTSIISGSGSSPMKGTYIRM